jgi:hypothetical protein
MANAILDNEGYSVLCKGPGWPRRGAVAIEPRQFVRVDFDKAGEM